MNISDCFYLGYISRIWSNSNRLIIKLDTDQPEKYKKLESVLIQLHKQDQNPVPFFITKSHQVKGKELMLDIDLGHHFPDTSFLKGKSVYLPLAQLPELGDKQFYYHEVEGFTAIDEVKGEIGIIKGIIDNTANPLISIESGQKEILIPISDATIKKVERKEKILRVSAPEGLIDLYLED